MVAPLDIASRQVGPGRPCFIIAEAGVNHNGDMDLARRLIDVARDAGADAVKFQTFRAEALATPGAPKAAYQARSTAATESQFQMLRRLELSEQAHRDLQAHCRAGGILFLSTPFDERSADLLQRLDVPAFKIPSGELTNLPFLAHVARKGRPLIISTGMATMDEVAVAVGCCRSQGNSRLALLHCVSNYPAAPADVNLRAMNAMAREFDLPVGYSDHTIGLAVALAAVALGACIIEKHFTLDRSLAGPDHRALIEPAELAELVRGIRTVEAAMGSGEKIPAASEANTASVARKSLVAARDIPAGAEVTADAVAILRPGSGLAPGRLAEIVGRRARIAIPAGTLITLEALQ